MTELRRQEANGSNGKLRHRHERFAQEYVVAIYRGVPQPEFVAYRLAGYPDTPSAYGNARRLLHKPHVKARVREILDQQATLDGHARSRIAGELCRLAFANIADLFEADADGKVRLKDITALPREFTAAIAGFDQSGRPKMYDKTSALVALAKLMGLSAEDDAGKKAVGGLGDRLNAALKRVNGGQPLIEHSEN